MRPRGLFWLDTHPKLALFCLALTSAGSFDPVTSLIAHRRPDCLFPAGLVVRMSEGRKRRGRSLLQQIETDCLKANGRLGLPQSEEGLFLLNVNSIESEFLLRFL